MTAFVCKIFKSTLRISDHIINRIWQFNATFRRTLREMGWFPNIPVIKPYDVVSTSSQRFTELGLPKKPPVPLRPRSIIREHLQRYQMFQCRFQETHFYYFFHIQRPFFTCHFFDCIPNRIISPPTNATISEKSALCSCINQFLLKNLRRRFNIGGC